MILVVKNTLLKLGLFTINESDEVELLDKTLGKMFKTYVPLLITNLMHCGILETIYH